jgi:hypothetical protein
MPLADFGYYMSLNICDIHLLLQQASKWQSVPLHLLESLQQVHSSLILNLYVPVEEEVIPDYNPKFFYLVNPGDIFHDRYKTTAKVGWGTCLTVWLWLGILIGTHQDPLDLISF